jgi:hypothetical protein
VSPWTKTDSADTSHRALKYFMLHGQIPPSVNDNRLEEHLFGAESTGVSRCLASAGTNLAENGEKDLRSHCLKFRSERAGSARSFGAMKALLGIALGAAVIYLALKTTKDRARSLPTLHPVRDAEPTRPEPLRDADLNVAQNAPF